MESRFDFKDFEKVVLKATYEMKIGNRVISPGEVIVTFDDIQIARIADEVNVRCAQGGFDNRGHVYWTTTKDEIIDFSQGVFSSTQFALLNNANLIEIEENVAIPITNTEELETNENGIAVLAQNPQGNLWIYNKDTGDKITNYVLDGKQITLATPFLDVIVIYTYNYVNGAKNYKLGQQLISGYVELEGRTRVKDDTTGQVVTGILKIPKLKLMSNLSIRLGKQASPVVGNFSGIAIPVGSRGNTYVSEFYLLNDDIESDL